MISATYTNPDPIFRTPSTTTTTGIQPVAMTKYSATYPAPLPPMTAPAPPPPPSSGTVQQPVRDVDPTEVSQPPYATAPGPDTGMGPGTTATATTPIIDTTQPLITPAPSPPRVTPWWVWGIGGLAALGAAGGLLYVLKHR